MKCHNQFCVYFFIKISRVQKETKIKKTISGGSSSKSYYRLWDIEIEEKKQSMNFAKEKHSSISGRSSSKIYYRLCDIEIEEKKQSMNFAKEKHSYEMELLQQKVALNKLEIMRKKT